MITYQVSATSANKDTCSIDGKTKLEPCFMSIQDIHTELEQITLAIRERMESVNDTILSYNPSESYWATECELMRAHQLKMALPSFGSEAAMAKARIEERIALKKAKRSSQPAQLLIAGLEL